MFVNLPKNTNIYAISAANATESSWATYCSPDDVVQGKHIGSCLGDLFSVSFIEDIDNGDMTTETLDQQFLTVKKLTTRSNVLQWGDLSFVRQYVSDFIGKSSSLRRHQDSHTAASIKPYFAKINFLSGLYKRQPTKQHLDLLLEEMRLMHKFDNLFFSLQQDLSLHGNYNPYIINFDCLKTSINKIEQKCGRLSEYSYQYIKYLAQNCENNQSDSINDIVDRICSVV